jgi:hypothetical protein
MWVCACSCDFFTVFVLNLGVFCYMCMGCAQIAFSILSTESCISCRGTPVPRRVSPYSAISLSPIESFGILPCGVLLYLKEYLRTQAILLPSTKSFCTSSSNPVPKTFSFCSPSTPVLNAALLPWEILRLSATSLLACGKGTLVFHARQSRLVARITFFYIADLCSLLFLQAHLPHHSPPSSIPLLDCSTCNYHPAPSIGPADPERLLRFLPARPCAVRGRDSRSQGFGLI